LRFQEFEMNRRFMYSLVGTVGLAVWPPDVRVQETAPIAIVVNPSTQISDISFTRLRKIFLGDEQFWDGKQRITLLVRAPVAREREIVLKRIYAMSEAQFRQYWIAKLFRAEVSAGPKIVYSTDMAKQLVIALPGAVAFLPAAEVGTMKVLRIDGKLPGEPGYKLQ
jgi:hypothetical protein